MLCLSAEHLNPCGYAAEVLQHLPALLNIITHSAQIGKEIWVRLTNDADNLRGKQLNKKVILSTASQSLNKRNAPIHMNRCVRAFQYAFPYRESNST